jgi:hypothetical protein
MKSSEASFGAALALITPNPATVTVNTIASIPGVTKNTLFTTKDSHGHRVVIPVLCGPSCLLFCHHAGPGGKPGAIALWGVGENSSTILAKLDSLTITLHRT